MLSSTFRNIGSSLMQYKSFHQVLSYHFTRHAEEEKKPYEQLLSSSLEYQVRIPHSKRLNQFNKAKMMYLMKVNEGLNENQNRVTEANVIFIENLMNRKQLSLEAITIFLSTIYKELDKANDSFEYNYQLSGLLNRGVVCKLVKACEFGEAYYNQSFREATSLYIFRILESSNQFEKYYHQWKGEMLQEYEKSSKSEKDEATLKSNLLDLQFGCKYLSTLDFLQGFFYCLQRGYYRKQQISDLLQKLKIVPSNPLGIQPTQTLFAETCLKIEIIQLLIQNKDKLKQYEVSIKELEGPLYSSYLRLYKSILSSENMIYQLLKDEALQSLLITKFLQEHFRLQIKDLYLKIFKKLFDSQHYGILLSQTTSIQAIFQIILKFYNHQDSRDIIFILSLFEKSMRLYTKHQNQNLNAFFFLCEKYSYQSDFISEMLITRLVSEVNVLEKWNTDNYKNYLSAEDYIQLISICRRFMVFLNIVENKMIMRKEFELGQKILFDLYKKYLLHIHDCKHYGHKFLFLNNTDLAGVRFYKEKITNIFWKSAQKRRIKDIATKQSLFNFLIHQQHFKNKQSEEILLYKTNQSSQIKWNLIGRLSNFLEITNYVFEMILVNKSKQVVEDIFEKFYKILFENLDFYRLIKKNICYPNGMLKNLLKLFDHQKQYLKQVEVIEANSSRDLISKDVEFYKNFMNEQIKKITKDNSHLQPHPLFLDCMQTMTIKPILIPIDLNIYSISNFIHCFRNDILYTFLHLFKTHKKQFYTKVFTAIRTNKIPVEIIPNHIEYPHYCDYVILKKKQNIKLAIFLRFNQTKNREQPFWNKKMLELQIQSIQYYKKNGFETTVIQNEKQLQSFAQIFI